MTLDSMMKEGLNHHVDIHLSDQPTDYFHVSKVLLRGISLKRFPIWVLILENEEVSIIVMK